MDYTPWPALPFAAMLGPRSTPPSATMPSPFDPLAATLRIVATGSPASDSIPSPAAETTVKPSSTPLASTMTAQAALGVAQGPDALIVVLPDPSPCTTMFAFTTTELASL